MFAQKIESMFMTFLSSYNQLLAEKYSLNEEELNDIASSFFETSAQVKTKTVKPTKKCEYIFTKGKSEGNKCAISVQEGKNYCKKHSSVKEKKDDEDIEEEDEEITDINSLTDKRLKKEIKNIISNANTNEDFSHRQLRRILEQKFGFEENVMDELKDKIKDICSVIVNEEENELETEEEPPKQKKTKKENKEKKKKKSGYILFSNETRKSLKEDDPNLSSKEVMKMLGSLWSDLSAEEKEVFNNRAKEL